MSYTIEEGYPKLRDIDKDNLTTAQSYKNMFDAKNILDAHNLIDDDIESENYNGFIAFTANKINALKEILNRLQTYWFNILNKLLGWFQNIGQDAQPYLGGNYINKIGGRTVVKNQLIHSISEGIEKTGGTTSISGDIVTFTASESGQQVYKYFARKAGRKYFSSVIYKTTSATADVKLRAFGVDFAGTATATWQSVSAIIDSTMEGGTSIGVIDRRTSGFDAIEIKDIMCIDLTQMFGAGNEPTTVEEVQAIIGTDYIPYNAGEIVSADVESVDVQGKNIWDEEWEVGGIIQSSGLPYSANDRIRSKNYSDCLPNTNYYGTSPDVYVSIFWYDADNNYIKYESASNKVITSPQNAYKFKIVHTDITTYNNDICINISNASLDGQYSPYTHTSIAIPAGVQALDGYGWSAGSVYNEVDYANKKYIKRVGRVDLGSLYYQYNESSLIGVPCFHATIPNIKPASSNNICAQYENLTNRFSITSNMQMAIGNSSEATYIVFRNDSYSTASEFKQAMNGVMLYYELAEPIVTDISSLLDDGFLENISVEEGGTITFKQSELNLPVPNEVDYNTTNGAYIDDDIAYTKQVPANCISDVDTYNKGDVVIYNSLTYMCAEENVTGAFDQTKWIMLTPSDVGFDITDATITTNNDNKVRTISYDDEDIAIILPNMTILEDEANAINGMVYLIESDGGSHQIKYKHDDDVDELYPYTNSTISLYAQGHTIQSVLNDLKTVMGV